MGDNNIKYTHNKRALHPFAFSSTTSYLIVVATVVLGQVKNEAPHWHFEFLGNFNVPLAGLSVRVGVVNDHVISLLL